MCVGVHFRHIESRELRRGRGSTGAPGPGRGASAASRPTPAAATGAATMATRPRTAQSLSEVRYGLLLQHFYTLFVAGNVSLFLNSFQLIWEWLRGGDNWDNCWIVGPQNHSDGTIVSAFFTSLLNCA